MDERTQPATAMVERSYHKAVTVGILVALAIPLCLFAAAMLRIVPQ
jgi:hypothetical protein